VRLLQLGLAGWLSVLVASCTGTEETLRIVFPEGAADAASRLVVTVIDPTAGAEAGVPFASCAELGAFGPTRLLQGNAAQPAAPAVLERFEAELPVENADFVLPARRASADNPWGVVAVLVEAVGEVVDASELEAEPRFGEASVLQSCYCARTLPGRHPDGDLDARVKAACPFAGGTEGTAPAERELVMGAVMPEEFELEACGTSSGVLVAETEDQRTAPACIRTRLCANAPPGNLCFDCPSPCDRVSDLSGAIVEYRVVTGSIQPERQRVATNPDGEAWPVFSSAGCGAGDEGEVEVTVPGRRTGALRFSLRCVGGSSVQIVAQTDEAFTSDEQDVLFLPSLLVLPTDPSWVLVGTRFELQAWQRRGERFEPGPKAFVESEVKVTSALFGRARTEGTEVAAVVRRVALGDGQRVTLPRFLWNGPSLELTDDPPDEACATCTCGSGSCAGGVACTDGERCIGGVCRPDQCPCEYQPLDPLSLTSGAGDFDGDDALDVLVSWERSAGSTSYYGGGDGTTTSCRCDLNEFSASRFVIADLDGDGRDDTVWQRDEGPALRLAQDRTSSCGSARPLGPPLEQPVLASGSLRCAADTSCPGRDLLTLSNYRRGRVLFADPAILDGDLERFERAGTHSRFRLLRAEAGNGSRLSQVTDGDFNGDGFADVGLVFFDDGPRVELLLGDGRGNLIPFPRRLSPADFGCAGTNLRLASGDTDGDGRSEGVVRCPKRIRVVEIR